MVSRGNKKGTHSYIPDARNDEILIYVNGEYLRRSDAKISVFDSGFLLGDGVWEGIRYHQDTFIFLGDHLDRLYNGAEAISIDIGFTKVELCSLLDSLMRKNNMSLDVHVRLIVTRGQKRTPYQHPNVNIKGSSVVIIPEYKRADKQVNQTGIKLAKVDTIRSTKQILDPKINSLSKLNCILACIEADNLDVDEGLMLDINGHVSTCNSTNFFIVRDNKVFTSRGEYCLNGVTRGKVIEICKKEGISINQVDFTINDVHNADEAFVTGTFAGIIPVTSIDSHQLSGGKRGDVTQKLQLMYRDLIVREYSRN